MLSRTIALAVIVAALVAVPFLLGSYVLGIITTALIAALFAVAFNLLSGQAGMLSFGHSAYFAIGGFATIHAMKAVESGGLWLPTPLIPLAGGVCGLVMGLVAGIFATRRSGVYFSMVTLAIAELLHSVAPVLDDLFGGEAGLSSMRMPWAGIGYGSGTHVYFTVLVWVLAGIALLYAYNLTLFGRLTIGLRESERRLSFLGYNTNATKVVVFAVSAMFSGLAGGLLVFANESINYSSLSMGASSAVILHTFVGGSSMFLGPVLGAGLFTLLGSVVTDLTKNWLLYQGLLFILIMMFMGDGLSMLISRVTSEVRQRNWAGLLHRLQLLVGGMTGVTGFVLGMELITRVLDRQYQGAKAMSEQWPAIALAGIDWQPDQALTWVVPAALMLAGSAIIGWVIWRNRQRHPLAALQQEAAR